VITVAPSKSIGEDVGKGIWGLYGGRLHRILLTQVPLRAKECYWGPKDWLDRVGLGWKTKQPQRKVNYWEKFLNTYWGPLG